MTIDAAQMRLSMVNGSSPAVAPTRRASAPVDYATYEAYEQYGAWTDDKGKPVPCSPRRQLPALTPGEQHLYQFLIDPEWTRVRRVEQERIPLRVAAARLDAHSSQDSHAS